MVLAFVLTLTFFATTGVSRRKLSSGEHFVLKPFINSFTQLKISTCALTFRSDNPMAAIHSSSQLLRIAIIGGGPGGLTLARVLQKHGVRATVFERERSANSRSQGGSLDLHGESGLKALRVAGLFGEFLKCARYEGEQMRVIDKSGIVHLDEEGPMGPPEEAGENYQGRPEIDRFVLIPNFLSLCLTYFVS